MLTKFQKKYRFFLFLFLSTPAIVPLYANDMINTKDAQAFQKKFDESHFEINKDFEKLRHIFLHLVKTTGKIATYCEVKEHGKVEPDPSPLVNEAIADLLIHALQIANYYQVDLGEKYEERIKFIMDRSDSQKRKNEP